MPARDRDNGPSEEIRDALSVSPAEWAAFTGAVVALDLTVDGSIGEAKIRADDRLQAYSELRESIRSNGDDFARVRDNLFNVRNRRRDLERDEERRGLSAEESDRLEDYREREAELEDRLRDLYSEIGADVEGARSMEDAFSRELLVLERQRPSAALGGDGAVYDPRQGWSPPAEREEADIEERRRALRQKREALTGEA